MKVADQLYFWSCSTVGTVSVFVFSVRGMDVRNKSFGIDVFRTTFSVGGKAAFEDRARINGRDSRTFQQTDLGDSTLDCYLPCASRLPPPSRGVAGEIGVLIKMEMMVLGVLWTGFMILLGVLLHVVNMNCIDCVRGAGPGSSVAFPCRPDPQTEAGEPLVRP
ncbi:hypothetical protein BaRGS_00016352 [Batillaria attramentaria]|uniref:Uncharacterized protein n=1 Tax=Batillaria attramentaria TaxID=370345 RepID=A0ABD0KZ19_9CAEN